MFSWLLPPIVVRFLLFSGKKLIIPNKSEIRIPACQRLRQHSAYVPAPACHPPAFARHSGQLQCQHAWQWRAGLWQWRAGRNPKQIQNSNFRMFKTVKCSWGYDFLRFGHLNFGNFLIVSIFDIRISYFPAYPG